jgi:hypothetical protein
MALPVAAMDVLVPTTAVPLAAGLVCLASGLWMLLCQRARAPLSLIVLLVGAGLVSIPVLGRQPEVATMPAPAPVPVKALPDGLTLSADGLQTVAAPVAASPPPALPGRAAVRIEIEASEAEPNDTLASANEASIGSVIVGSLAAGDLDFFGVEIPTDRRADLMASLLVLEGDAGLTIFDDVGQALGSADTNQQISVRTTTLERKIDRARYVILVRGAPPGASASYQLTISTRSR